MNTPVKICVFSALLTMVGCSSIAPDPGALEADATAVAAVSCPVCPTLEPQLPLCPEPQVIEKIVTVTVPPPAAKKATTAGDMHLPIVGAVEWVTVEPGDIRVAARIDTGAATSSIHAENIQLIEKDGKRWVNFTLMDPKTQEQLPIERPLRRKVSIKQSDSESQRRYVVQLWITLGDIRSQVDVTLTDREHMEYPLSIGRNLLVDTVIVDVSRRHIVAK